MKYIFSFFMLLVYIIVGFFHNSMITFAMQENLEKEMNMHHNQQQVFGQSMDCCGEENTSKNKDNNHECCYKSDSASLSNVSFIGQESSKILKIKIKNFIDIYAFLVNSFSNKNLINKTSPPDFNRDVKNYSYKDLIKIIKSNT